MLAKTPAVTEAGTCMPGWVYIQYMGWAELSKSRHANQTPRLPVFSVCLPCLLTLAHSCNHTCAQREKLPPGSHHKISPCGYMHCAEFQWGQTLEQDTQQKLQHGMQTNTSCRLKEITLSRWRCPAPQCTPLQLAQRPCQQRQQPSQPQQHKRSPT